MESIAPKGELKMRIKRISDEVLKDNGFEQVDSMRCFKNGSVVVSWGLIVAIGNVSAVGYHDYSQRTAVQVTRATGVNTATRRKKWNIISEEKFEEKVNKWLEVNIRK